MGRSRDHRVSDIAAQAGLSRATVDRVLHERPGVRRATIAQVERAVAELDRQRDQVHLSSQTLIVDLVMQTPARFATACRDALEAELRGFRPAVLRARSHLSEQSDPAAVAALLGRLARDAVAGRRSSHGVILKAPDDVAVRQAVDQLAAAGVPTVTFVTDVAAVRRAAYVGLDNGAAGATAAYLIAQLAGQRGTVLATISHSSFRGEEEREQGFTAALAELAPRRRIVTLQDTDGLDRTLLVAVRAALAQHRGIDAVYSAGGGNLATLQAFSEAGRVPRAYIAHDLDGDNLALLRTRRISAVLHHDLRADLRRACQLLLQARGVLPGRPATVPTPVQVVTPFNEPAGLSPS